MSITANDFVNVAKSWIGRKEADGTHKGIIDLYNSYTPHPRGYVMNYKDAWCACMISAIAIKLNATNIIPIECSCYYMIEKAKQMGIWNEADNITPKIGYFVLYDWDDNGKGDNKGTPDHIGVVSHISGNRMEVIEGNYSNSVKIRVINVNAKYIRGYISPKYGTVSKPIQNPLKSVSEVAKEVIKGLWGNGNERKTRLTNAGYDYNTIQKEVNNLSKASETFKTPVKLDLSEHIKDYQKELNKQFKAGLSITGVFDTATYKKAVNVKKGARGNITLILQRVLTLKGYPLEQDGIYGIDTETKVMKFQKAKGLVIDGIAGKNTFKALFS